jgi:hypothetical protein
MPRWSLAFDCERRERMKPSADRRRTPELLAKYSSAIRERIAKAAYELYEQRGRRDGQDLDDWLTAEAIVMREIHDRGE